MTIQRYAAAILALLIFSVARAAADGRDYDPLKVGKAKPQTLDLVVHDADRDRNIPVLVYLPVDQPRARSQANEKPRENSETTAADENDDSTDRTGAPAKSDDSEKRASRHKPAPVVLFSHGLGGSRNGSKFLGEHWARRGYVAVFVQHPGSDTSAWKDAAPGERMESLKKAANGEQFMLRVKDIPAVLDQLGKWNDDRAHDLHGRLDMHHIGMSGHSFGAVTTQAVSGQSYLGKQPFTDKRILAAIPFSPSTPKREKTAERSFDEVKIPWLLMTGTNDNSPIGDQTPETRRMVFPALPRGDKYELVLDGAEHSVFTDRALPGEKHERNPNHHRAILAISTAFWDAYLRDDADAKKWLAGDGPRSVLEEADSWQKK